MLELLLSALQAPLRMLAHSVFVLGALTGLRLDWKSPSRDALAVTWRDALAGIGLLALPTLAMALLALQGRDVSAPYLAPLLLPLLLAVPFTVWTAGPQAGRRAEARGPVVGSRRATPAARTVAGGSTAGLHRSEAAARAGAESVEPAWRGASSWPSPPAWRWAC